MDNTRSSQQPRINYVAPLVAAILSSSFLLLLTMLLLYLSVSNALNTSEGGLLLICGLGAILFLVAGCFFAVATFKGVRDLFTPLQTIAGTVVGLNNRGQDVPQMMPTMPSFRRNAAPDALSGDKGSRRQSPPFWLVIDPDLGSRLEAATPPPAPPASQSVAPSTRRVFGISEPATEQPDPARKEPDPPASDDLRLVLANRAAHSRQLIRFRVDRPAYEAVHTGNRVVIAHSRYLEHVYYVQRLDEFGSQTILNKSLL